ncbi:MAG: lysine--tRNA ligase [Elusimicrobia bacterium CG_4_10_14_0_2_um_filter_56_8]|nr:MAG: lysine--tRNA ligase [Elusimicrobia bacterium CG1_02_56_21]PJA13554.1 MAG: lysine--tRNA ligase [Elusimicrobia bacterium CG_4_10_14_0_2_um_filter_56_8]
MTTTPNSGINEIVANNYAKIKAIREKGVDPFPHRFKLTHKIAQAAKCPAETPVVIAGRMVLMRVMGKAAFAHLKDGTGKIQIYVKKDSVGEESYDLFKKQMHVGDFLGVEGKLFVTHTGELTVNAEKLTVLSKSVRPLPEKFHGLTDAEARYRERYLDLISNEEARTIFIRRSRIVASIRDVLNSDGYLEVETPVLCAQAGGASARPFITYHNAYKYELYMRIATELPLKKLLIGGFDGAYEIGRVFRNEGVDTRHNPEFTTLEAYKAYSDYNGMAELVETIFEKCAAIIGADTIDYNGMKINIKPPFRRMSLPGEWLKKTGEDIHEVLKGKAFNREKLKKLAEKLHIEHGSDTTSAKLFDRIMDEKILASLEQPTFVMDYPTAVTPLAKCKAGDESLVERFEFFAGTEEIANAYSELNDPEDQQSRLVEQLRQQEEENNGEADILDKDFIEAMEYGMPPMGGIGIGIDRLTMLLSGKPSIREVILFPLLRPDQPQ